MKKQTTKKQNTANALYSWVVWSFDYDIAKLKENALNCNCQVEKCGFNDSVYYATGNAKNLVALMNSVNVERITVAQLKEFATQPFTTIKRVY